MGALLGLGMSHYPGFLYSDGEMADLPNRIRGGKIPPELTDPASWPEPMRSEWGTDGGASFAAQHRADFMAAVAQVRAALDDFAPDAVIICGEDRYETFQEDLVPPFCVFLRDEYVITPFAGGRAGRPVARSYWGDEPDFALTVPGAKRIAGRLSAQLIESDFDLCTSYTSPHGTGLCHSFANTLLYLDNERTGWPHPVIPLHVNSYGTHMVRAGMVDDSLLVGESEATDPPPPTPARAFALGRALARAALAGPWRIAVIGSASWSHSVGIAKTQGLYPDLDSDRARYAELRDGHYARWAELGTPQLVAAGQTEFLNWLPMVGAMHEAGAGAPRSTSLHETYLMSSIKATAIFDAIEG